MKMKTKNYDAAKSNTLQTLDSLSANFKRKRGSSADVKAIDAALFRPLGTILQDPSVVVIPITRIRSSAGSAASPLGSGASPLKRDNSSGSHIPTKAACPTESASSRDHNLRKVLPSSDQVLHQCPKSNSSNHPASVAVLRPRKQSRPLPGLATEKIPQKKQGLINKLRSHGCYDDSNFVDVDDAEGYVSGEDVFSQEKKTSHLNTSFKETASAFPSSYTPSAGEPQNLGFERLNQTSFDEEAGWKLPSPESASLCALASITSPVTYRGGESYKGTNREIERGAASQKQPSCVYQLSKTSQTRYPPSSALEKLEESPYQKIPADFDTHNGTWSSRSRSSGEKKSSEVPDFHKANAFEDFSAGTNSSTPQQLNGKYGGLNLLAASPAREIHPLRRGMKQGQSKVTQDKDANGFKTSVITSGTSLFMSASLAEDRHQRITKGENVSSVSRSGCHRKASLEHHYSSGESSSLFDAHNVTRPPNVSDYVASQPCQDVIARMYPTMRQQKQNGVDNQLASHSRENRLFHSRTPIPRTAISPQEDKTVEALLKTKEESRAIFDLQYLLSTSSVLCRNSLQESSRSSSSNITARGTAFHDKEMEAVYATKSAKHNNSNEAPQRKDVPTFPSNHSYLSEWPRKESQESEPLRYRDISNFVALNTDAVANKRVEEVSMGGGDVNSRLRSMSIQRHASHGRSTRCSRLSRDIFARIEADMMRVEEGGTVEMSDVEPPQQLQQPRIDTSRVGIRSGSMHGIHQPALMNERYTLNEQEQPHQASRGWTLADQISNMALESLCLEADDYSSSQSIESWESFDGKCTNIFASHPQTPDQELACHTLSNAISDLYAAPVGRILSQHPIVTRLIQAGDETGNVQLHYAVRNGNVKAIRRILRADPDCALIRNIQGYCPLHFAVQIGNFGAVQLFCCMAPASAKVQCEEGYLPLHEALSSAAHLPGKFWP